MRTLRFLVATLNALIGAYLLLMANGIYIAIQERSQGWHITPLPSHPVARIVMCLGIGFALQLVSARLLMPPATRRGTAGFWGDYAARVGLCIAACFVAAVFLFLLVMALLDAGVI
jgi:hypothetical protein